MASHTEIYERMKENYEKAGYLKTPGAMDDKTKLKFVYLFLSVGKRLIQSNYQLFEEIGKSYHGYSGFRRDVIDECEKILALADESSRFTKITSYFLAKAGAYIDISNRDILWAFISLVNQMKNKSDDHQKLIDLWIEQNNIDKSIVLEMIDTCQTQHAMVEYDKWLEANKDIFYSEDNSIYQELKKNVEGLEQSVNALIALG